MNPSNQRLKRRSFLSAATGGPIRYFGVTLDMVRQQQGEDGARMAQWFQDVGYGADIARLRREFPDVGWHTYADWAKSVDWKAVLAEPRA